VPRETPSHWGGTYTVEVQELSGLSWPIRSCLTTAEGWYEESQGRRHDLVPVLKGLCLQRKVSHATMRAGVFLSIIAGGGLSPGGLAAGGPLPWERWEVLYGPLDRDGG
jgi:hypothetical protein